jgi:hypothetical protein
MRRTGRMQRLECAHNLRGRVPELFGDLALEFVDRPSREQCVVHLGHQTLERGIQTRLEGLRDAHCRFLATDCNRTSARPQSLRIASGDRPKDSPISA